LLNATWTESISLMFAVDTDLSLIIIENALEKLSGLSSLACGVPKSMRPTTFLAHCEAFVFCPVSLRAVQSTFVRDVRK
jgi:hypothetical protein